MRKLAIGFFAFVPLLITVALSNFCFHFLAIWVGAIHYVNLLIALTSIILYPVILGTFSLPFHSAIKKARAKRDLSDNLYFRRAIYGKLFTSLFYAKPIYLLVQSFPLLFKLVFSLFGYRGSYDVVIAPDAWIRDLPILHLSKDAYIANRVTMGTNVCLRNNEVYVEDIWVDKGSLIAHLAILAPGCKIGSQSEVGVSCLLGFKVKIQDNVTIGGRVGINHGAKLENGCQIGAQSYIGIRSVIGSNVTIPPVTIVPDGKKIQTQAEVDELISSETKLIQGQKTKMEELLDSFDTHK